MRVLVLTNHLAAYAGSELVALEVAECFNDLGCHVEIFAAYIDEPLLSVLNSTGYKFGLIEDCPNPLSFDIVWSQHQLLPYLFSKYPPKKTWNTFIVSISLSPFEPYEMPGAIVDAADLIVANSLETAERLQSVGVNRRKIEIFHNAAPNHFDQDREHNKSLTRLLIISNHAPKELVEATAILQTKDINVQFIGFPNQQRRITPKIISCYDAVVSIGKSVQYCLLSETPVYIYDRFGGPGWLSLDNFPLASKMNFSGRCSNRHLKAEHIASELVNGYNSAVASIIKLKKNNSEKYKLFKFLLSIKEKTKLKVNPTLIDERTMYIIIREGILSKQLIDYDRLANRQQQEIENLYKVKDNYAGLADN